MDYLKRFAALLSRYQTATNAFLESSKMKLIYRAIGPIVPFHDYMKIIESLLQHCIYYSYCCCKLRAVTSIFHQYRFFW